MSSSSDGAFNIDLFTTRLRDIFIGCIYGDPKLPDSIKTNLINNIVTKVDSSTTTANGELITSIDIKIGFWDEPCFTSAYVTQKSFSNLQYSQAFIPAVYDSVNKYKNKPQWIFGFYEGKGRTDFSSDSNNTHRGREFMAKIQRYIIDELSCMQKATASYSEFFNQDMETMITNFNVQVVRE